MVVNESVYSMNEGKFDFTITVGDFGRRYTHKN